MQTQHARSTLDLPIVIIGGGISGLALAYYCLKQGLKPLVLEANPYPGGLIQTVQQDGFLAEAGPNGFLVRDQDPILELSRSLGLADELLTAEARQKKRYIFLRDRYGIGGLHAVPFSPAALLSSRLLSARGKMRLLAEPFIAPAGSPDGIDDESLADFTRRRFGHEVLTQLIDPMVTGIYAGDPELLSAQSAFPKIKELEWQYGSLIKGALRSRKQPGGRPQLYSLRHGLNGLTGRLADHLGPQHLWLDSQLRTVQSSPDGFLLQVEQRGQSLALRAQKLIMATAPQTAALLTTSLDPQLAAALRAFGSASIVSVSLGWHTQDLPRPLDGYGFLVPSKEKLRLLGAIWASSLFRERAPQGHALITCMLGGVRHPEIIDWDDAQLLATLQEDLRTTMGMQAAPVFTAIHRWRQAIPQYQVGHRRKVAQLIELQHKQPGLYFTGNYIDGISVAHCVERVKKLAAELSVPPQIGQTFDKPATLIL